LASLFHRGTFHIDPSHSRLFNRVHNEAGTRIGFRNAASRAKASGVKKSSPHGAGKDRPHANENCRDGRKRVHRQPSREIIAG
jgi:hypothetical protein